MTFRGFPEQALVFYEGLEADNSKAYWTDHKQVYDDCVAGPLRALLDELGPEFGEAKVFRPYRDVRFSKDKSPYKTTAAAAVTEAGGGALYLQLSAEGLMVGGGYYDTTTAQARRLRAAIADDRTGPQLMAVLEGLQGYEPFGEPLKRLPKEYDEDHPRAAWLRQRSLALGRSWAPAAWLHKAACKDRVAEAWRALQPLNEWLGRCVGPATRD
jgi:uncharacterized protein (TIGR02453 family)